MFLKFSLSRSAFTLVELMIVIAIIGILAVALFPSMSNYIARANNRALIEEIRKIGMAANLMYIDLGAYSSDTIPSNCAYFPAWSATDAPNFVLNGGYSLEKWKTVAQKLNPGYCMDWNNWDHRGPTYAGWASVDVHLVGLTGWIDTVKRYCLYNGRVDTNINQCQNIGIDP